MSDPTPIQQEPAQYDVWLAGLPARQQAALKAGDVAEWLRLASLIAGEKAYKAKVSFWQRAHLHLSRQLQALSVEWETR